MEGAATQLADTRPQLDTPLRVAIPVNAPERIAKLSRDQYIHINAFSPHALAEARIKKSDLGVTDLRQVHNKKLDSSHQIALNTDHDAISKTAIRDFNLLAFSSKRSAKKDEEATAYASLGVIFDNQANFLHAIEVYKTYLQICEEIGDIIGSACACNCIGVNYLLLACPPSDTGCLQGIKLTSTSRDYLDKAAYYHSKHLEIGPDSGGKFVANTNLGLCYGMSGDINASAKHHQDALRTAIKMQTLYGQSIAVGNLGLLALVKGDFSTSRTCFDQHLQLVQALLDPEAEIQAWKMLANLNVVQENHVEALEDLEEARRIAEKEGYLNELRRIHCLIGVSRGTLQFTEFTDSFHKESSMSTPAGYF